MQCVHICSRSRLVSFKEREMKQMYYSDRCTRKGCLSRLHSSPTTDNVRNNISTVLMLLSSGACDRPPELINKWLDLTEGRKERKKIVVHTICAEPPVRDWPRGVSARLAHRRHLSIPHRSSRVLLSRSRGWPYMARHMTMRWLVS